MVGRPRFIASYKTWRYLITRDTVHSSLTTAPQLPAVLYGSEPVVDRNLDDAGCDELADLPRDEFRLASGICRLLRPIAGVLPRTIRRCLDRPVEPAEHSQNHA